VIATMLTVTVIGAMIIGSAGLYLLPLIIAAARRAPDLAAVALLDILLGWTFAGWVVALVLALRPDQPAAAGVQVIQNFAVPPPPPQFAGPGWPELAAPRPGTPPPLVLPPHPGGDQDGHE
jgi:hypothetical protein